MQYHHDFHNIQKKEEEKTRKNPQHAVSTTRHTTAPSQSRQEVDPSLFTLQNRNSNQETHTDTHINNLAHTRRKLPVTGTKGNRVQEEHMIGDFPQITTLQKCQRQNQNGLKKDEKKKRTTHQQLNAAHLIHQKSMEKHHHLT